MGNKTMESQDKVAFGTFDANAKQEETLSLIGEVGVWGSRKQAVGV